MADELKDKVSSRLFKFSGIFLAVLMVGMICFFIYGQFFTNPEQIFAGNCEEYSQEWTYVDKNAVKRTTTFPDTLLIDSGDPVTVSTVLPDEFGEGTYMCVLTSLSMRVSVDKKLRMTFDNSDNPIPGGYVKSHYMMINLSKEDRGKVLTIERYGKGVDNSAFTAVLFGDKIGILIYLLKQNGAQLFAAVLLFIFSLMTLITVGILMLLYKRKISVGILAVGMMMASLWFIFDSFLYQVLFENYYVDGPMEYMLTMSFPLLFIMYLNSVQKNRYATVYACVIIGICVNFVVQVVLHIKGIASFQDNLLLIAGGTGLVLLILFGTIFADVIRKRAGSYFLVALGFCGSMTCGIFQVIVLITTVDEHNALWLMAGLYLLLFCGLLQDVRELIAVEEQSRHAKQANELKSSFLANMSHEIRTPLNAILGMNEMISRESGEKHIREYAGNIESAGNGLLGIINDILDFSKIESGKMEIVESRYSLYELIKTSQNIISGRAEKKGLKFEVSAGPELPLWLQGDSNRIQQVLLNLLNNAVKYTETGTVKLSVEACKKDEEDMIDLRFSVKDTGIGIKEQDMSKLFRNFERLELKRNKSVEGTGLGLAITNNLVELMGGHIEVESVYGEGSEFIAVIPQKVLSKELLKDAECEKASDIRDAASEKAELSAPEARVLVVDDAPVNILVVKGLLKRTGMTIDSASSGKQCLEMCSKNNYDIILLDHMMPEMDGIETLKALMAEHADLCPVIALTANAIEGMKEMYLNEGFSDYLAKPTKPAELEAMVKKHLPADKLK